MSQWAYGVYTQRLQCEESILSDHAIINFNDISQKHIVT